MDYRIVFLKPARLDLKKQVRFKTLESSAEAGLAHFDRVTEAAQGLAQLPYRGRSARLLGDESGYRELILDPYVRLIYLVDEPAKTVKIVAVIDARQDFKHVWESQPRPDK